ncbi:MAG: glycosyltransferase family 4 protein [Thermoanaerobaculia bacterium]|nr:glycosyltransferase family 4 protein [Thermoanaerobaculia bacterium]
MPDANRSLERPLHVMEVETFGRGGLIHYSYNLSCSLAERGHRVSLVTSVGYELEDAYLPTGLEVEKRTARWTQGRRLRAALVYKLEALVDAVSIAWRAWSLRPDVVHLHCTNSILLFHLLLLRLVGFLRRTAVVATAHVVTPHETPNPGLVQRFVLRLIHRLPHLVIAHSEFDRQRLVDEFDVHIERTVTIPHGEYGFFERDPVGAEPLDPAEARRSLGLESGSEVALFFGYLREYKGLDVLLEAWRSVRELRPRARLVIAGDPVQLPAGRRRDLEDEARRLGAVCRFEYVPFSEVRRYFAVADVLVMPYRRISQSGVLFLALSLGVPVVATRVGGLPEILDDGDSALLVPPEVPEALAEAILRVLGDDALQDRLSAGGRRVAAEHSWATIAERTESTFRRFYIAVGAHSFGKPI